MVASRQGPLILDRLQSDLQPAFFPRMRALHSDDFDRKGRKHWPVA